jgi:hypothetical protein
MNRVTRKDGFTVSCHLPKQSDFWNVSLQEHTSFDSANPNRVHSQLPTSMRARKMQVNLASTFAHTPSSLSTSLFPKNEIVTHTLITCCPPSGFKIEEAYNKNARGRLFVSLAEVVEFYGYILKTPFHSDLSRQRFVFFFFFSFVIFFAHLSLV